MGKIKNLVLEAEEYGISINDDSDIELVTSIIQVNHALEDLLTTLGDVASNMNDTIITLNGAVDIINNSIIKKK